MWRISHDNSKIPRAVWLNQKSKKVDKMKFNSRTHVEQVGLSGAGYEETEEYYICNTLSSYKICASKTDLGYTKHAKNDGYWESWITYWMTENVKPGTLVADIGANHGYYSLLLATMGCNVDVYEPQPDLCELISHSGEISNLSDKLNIKNMAVSDSVGSAKFIIPKGHGMNATIKNDAYTPYSPEKEYDEYEVSTISLDSISETNYSFIKIDAEGGEEAIWNGMQSFIKNNPSTVILLEWNYNRYNNPELLANQIFNKYNASYVNFYGTENDTSIEDTLSVRDRDIMLVLRHK